MAVAARAQQPDRMQRIGVLMGYAEGNVEGQAFVAAFREELLKLGWAEGRNLRSDYRWASPGDVEATRRFAKELIALQPNLILAHNTAATAAAQEQTHTIPILFAIVADPVGSGFVTSLSRPGGNATGFTTLEPTMAGKWLELLKEIAPRVNRAAFMFNPNTAPYAELFVKALQGCSRVPGHVTARIVEEGPIPAIHGVVRWRACDLIMRLHEEFELSVSDDTIYRALKNLGFSHVSARPKAYKQNAEDMDTFKKTSPSVWRKSTRSSHPAHH
jgi:hypothetical protein